MYLTCKFPESLSNAQTEVIPRTLIDNFPAIEVCFSCLIFRLQVAADGHAYEVCLDNFPLKFDKVSGPLHRSIPAPLA